MTEAATHSFAARLSEATHHLHVEAERSGVMAELMRGRATAGTYALLLRNLLPAYQALEAGLERLRETTMIRPFARSEVYRSAAIKSDLVQLAGADWSAGLRELPEAVRYADVVRLAADGSGERLIAHAYTRTLGDLSGGQIVARLLERALGETANHLEFHHFPLIDDITSFKAGYRASLNAAGAALTEPASVLREAQLAFQLNIAVSRAVANESTALLAAND